MIICEQHPFKRNKLMTKKQLKELIRECIRESINSDDADKFNKIINAFVKHGVVNYNNSVEYFYEIYYNQLKSGKINVKQAVDEMIPVMKKDSPELKIEIEEHTRAGGDKFDGSIYSVNGKTVAEIGNDGKVYFIDGIAFQNI